VPVQEELRFKNFPMTQQGDNYYFYFYSTCTKETGKADASGLPLKSGIAESLGNQTEIEKGPKRDGCKVAVRPIDWKTTFPIKQRRKQKAAEMHPSAAEDTDEPPARKLPMVRTVEKAVVDMEGSQADSGAQSEVSNVTSHSSQEADKTRQLSCTEARKALVSEEDDLEKLLMEITGELEGEIDVDTEKDVDELLLELSEITDSVIPQSD
ncbi:hypothetical protein CIB84_009843, partial [Bambusicola thoracicus]